MNKTTHIKNRVYTTKNAMTHLANAVEGTLKCRCILFLRETVKLSLFSLVTQRSPHFFGLK